MSVNSHHQLHAEEQAVTVELQEMLIDLLDLTLIGKHLHWNVEGRHFRSVHHELDELVDAWRGLSDEVAERAVTIGGSPDGQVEAIAAATRLEALPAGRLSDRQALVAIGDRLADAAAETRRRIDRVTATDPVTGDLFVRVAATLQKQLWMIRAQRVESTGAIDAALRDRADDTNGGHRS